MTGRAPLFGLVGIVCLGFGLLGAYLAGSSLEQLGPLAAIVGANVILGLLFVALFMITGWEALPALVGQRKTRYGSGVAVSTLAFIAIVGVLAYLSTRHHARVDLTEAGVYGLSPQSRQVVADLREPLDLIAFVEGGVNEALQALLESYGYETDKVTFRLVDPDRSPDLVSRFGITTINSVRIAHGEESTVVTAPTEETLTNGIIKVTRTTKKVVCFVTGHGEPEIDNEENPRGYSLAKKGLENEHYEVKTILPASDGKIDEACSVVVVAGPTRPLLSGEIELLEAHLKAGRHLLVLLQPRGAPELVPLLARWGATVGNDIVVDQQLRLFQGPTIGVEPMAATYGDHPITKDFRRESITVYNLARSVEPITEDKPGLTTTGLVQTGPQSWAETDLAQLFDQNRVALDAADRKGPITLAVASSGKLKGMGFEGDGEARLVVFGNSRFADNEYLANPTFFNQDLFLNSVGWLVGQEELVSIRSRTVRSSRVQMTPAQNVLLFLTSVLLMPQLLLVGGIVVWWRRRSR
jgi:ABC-type uncharacterized transport system involved in gliding motility auxiliary subunit